MDTKAQKRSADFRRATVPIFGLACGGGGALTAERSLAKVPGVKRAYVNPLTEMAYVEYDPAITDQVGLIAAIESAGLRAGEPSLR
ncbi:MAG TPA: heavy metal-associated domain-containing protein [Rubrobacter sp.]|nr:heavy metal-associated domain-containing protein [Rubrobacter sp.]